MSHRILPCLLLGLLLCGGNLVAQEATHQEVDPLKIELGEEGKLETMAMNSQGQLLLGVSWKGKGAGDDEAREPRRGPGRKRGFGPTGPREYALKIVSPDGKVLVTRPLDFAPKMIHGCADGQLYICTEGRIYRFDESGKELGQLSFAAIDKAYAGGHASGVTASDKHFFLAIGEGFSLRATEDIVRLDRDLKNPVIVAKRQFGCCSHIDLDVADDVLLIAENSRHRVNRFTLSGELIDRWGGRNRTDIEGFAACCNPVNFDFGPAGELYTAESGIGRVKRYTAEGKYLGLVGYVDTTKFDRGSRLAAMSCYIPIEVNADASRIYIMDVRANFIRVLAKKE